MPAVWAVVVAGGVGERFGQLKQFATLGGVPVAARAVAACRCVASSVVLVVPAEHVGSTERYGADLVVAGGATRSASVREGLAVVPPDVVTVVVHDAARPLAPAAAFEAVLDALADGGAQAAVPGLPVADTLKEVDRPLGAGGPVEVCRTLDRSVLVAVQTPQAFVAETLRRAHRAGVDATDDAALVEALGATVRVVPGDPANLKLTTPADLAVAEALLGG